MNNKNSIINKKTVNYYLNKWKFIALSTVPVQSLIAKTLVENLYRLFLNINENSSNICNFSPINCLTSKNIYILDTPHAAFSLILKTIYNGEQGILESFFLKRVYRILFNQLELDILTRSRVALFDQFEFKFNEKFYKFLREQLTSLTINHKEYDYIYLNLDIYLKETFLWTSLCCWLDFCILELGCTYPEHEWLLFQAIAKHCGWTFFFENIAIICQRPTKIIKDTESYWGVWNLESEFKNISNFNKLD